MVDPHVIDALTYSEIIRESRKVACTLLDGHLIEVSGPLRGDVLDAIADAYVTGWMHSWHRAKR